MASEEVTIEDIQHDINADKALLIRCKSVRAARAEGIAALRQNVSNTQNAIRERLRTIEREGVLLRQADADCRGLLNEAARVR